MAHPTVWTQTLFFYPTGNTPATSFTQYLAPEQDGKLLILGCGDARSVLYTVHSDPVFVSRSLDFTFCDHEPAVLARNILLYTLLFDQCDEDAIEKIWNIYFHIFIDEGALSLLQTKCQKLLDCSKDLETWNGHPYGAFIKFCTFNTLSSLREYWQLYLYKNLDKGGREDLKQRFTAEMQCASWAGKGIILTASRSAGPLVMYLGQLGSDHFDHYWKYGVSSVAPKKIKSATELNPTFVYSFAGDKFNVHYGTDPILCFHLATALVPMEANLQTPATDLPSLVSVVQAQFRDWCTSFHDRLNTTSPSLVLRFFTGDALAFCRAFRHCAETGETQTPEYTNMWGGSTISFQSNEYGSTSLKRAPLSFDVIETSNLGDHLGVLNVLLAAAPLLLRSSTSVLHTNTLISSKGREGIPKSALEGIGIDLALISTLVGVVPERHLSEFTFQSHGHEILMSHFSESPQLHESNVWRIPFSSGVPLRHKFSCEIQQLADTLFAVYLDMFSDESLGYMRNILLSKKPSSQHFTRASFVHLLTFIKESFLGDWTSVMKRFFYCVETDRNLANGLNNYQDLCCALHLQNVHSVVPDPMSVDGNIKWNFSDWSNDVPKIVCVVLAVPRQKLRVLENLKQDQIGTPTLQCETIVGTVGHNIHSTFQPVFGKIEDLGSHAKGGRAILIREDKRGWLGDSDLIVYFYAPAHIFARAPAQRLQISLNLHSSPATIFFISELGPRLAIYTTSLSDSRHAFLLRERPRIIEEAGFTYPPRPSLSRTAEARRESDLPVSLKFADSKAVSFSMRTEVTNPKTASTLLDKSTKVHTKPTSNTGVEVSFKGFNATLHFPYPIETSSLVTRIARRSSYVEIEGRTLSQPKADTNLDPFPIVNDGTFPKLLNVHYLNLDRLPSIRSPLPPNTDMQWISTHCSLAMSDEERSAYGNIEEVNREALLNLKESVCNIFMRFLTEERGRPRVFILSDTEDGVYTMIFVSSIRFDLASSTVVADTCILPLTFDLVRTSSFMEKVRDVQPGMIEVRNYRHEVNLWKAALPAFVERCRSWKHKSTCEYIKEGIPRSSQLAKNPICSCGQGIGLGKFTQMEAWRPLAPLVTRAAIALPFTTSMMSKSFADVKSKMASSDARPAATAPAPDHHGSASASTSTSRAGSDVCAACGQLGKPKLLNCSACKRVRYCSKACQTSHWKKHKAVCLLMSKMPAPAT